MFEPSRKSTQVRSCKNWLPMVTRFLVIEDSGDEPIDWLGIGDAIEAIVNHAHRHAVGLVSPISLGRVEVAEIRTVRQSLFASQTHVLLDAPEKIGVAAVRAICSVPDSEKSRLLNRGQQIVK